MFHGNDGWEFMWIGWFFWLIIIGLIVWLILTISSKNKSATISQNVKESPLDILKRRYASGEINTQEYEERKKFLENDIPK